MGPPEPEVKREAEEVVIPAPAVSEAVSAESRESKGGPCGAATAAPPGQEVKPEEPPPGQEVKTEEPLYGEDSPPTPPDYGGLSPQIEAEKEYEDRLKQEKEDAEIMGSFQESPEVSVWRALHHVPGRETVDELEQRELLKKMQFYTRGKDCSKTLNPSLQKTQVIMTKSPEAASQL